MSVALALDAIWKDQPRRESSKMKLGHVHIKVKNLEKSKKYYTDVVGMRLMQEIEGQFAFLSLSSAYHDLALQQRDQIVDSSSYSILYHVAFEVQDTESLKQAK